MRNARTLRLVIASASLHLAAAVLVVARPSLWPIGLAIVIANHAVIAIACVLPRSSLFGRNVTRLPTPDGVVALTFDDGPDREVTPLVLELLDAAGAKATFFCIGKKAEANPSIVAAIRGRGHDVQNHSHTHPNLFALRGPSGVGSEIAAAQRAIESTASVRPRFFRAPAGMQNPWLIPVLDREGLLLVSWTRRGFDTVDRNGTRVASRLTRGLRGGDILLFHDGSSARDANGRPVVLDVLQRVLEAMKEKGLRSEPLSSVL